jgi:hypothetical protein
MSLVKALCQANQEVLKHKLILMSVLTEKHGVDVAHQMYQKTCPVIQATIGQHFRHSLDHVERAASAAISGGKEIHYDLRLRDTPDESNWTIAVARIESIHRLLTSLCESTQLHHPSQAVDAYFMLKGNESAEYCLPSTTARELGFAAHHAIHHMAMVKIIATCQHVGKLHSEDLPSDFGRAPSTMHPDHYPTTIRDSKSQQ